MSSEKITPHLLQKYLDGSCSEQERQLVESWYTSLNGESDFLGTLPNDEQQELQAKTYINIQKHTQIPTLRWSWRWAIGIAASLLLALGILRTLGPDGDNIDKLLSRTNKNEGIANVKIVNNEHKIALHLLPDSSKIWLHPDAVLSYPENFGKDKRSITFSGEAFFDITKDSKRPFVIKSGDMIVKVLGTSFNIKAGNNAKTFRVDVVTGKVEVAAVNRRKEEPIIVLESKQQALFETHSKRLTFNVSPIQAKKEIFEPISVTFDEARFDEVVEQLEKKFNINFHLKNPIISACRISADFEQQSLPMILEMLCTALGASYTLTGDTIVIEGGNCE